MTDIRADLVAILALHDGDPALGATAVLEYFGDVDPTSDVELIRWHLRESRTHIEELRAERDLAVAEFHEARKRAEAAERVVVAARVLDEACATGEDADVRLAVCSLLTALQFAEVPA